MSSKQKMLVILSPGFAASEEDSNCLPMQQAFVRELSKVYDDVGVIVLSFHYPFVRRKYDWFGVPVMSFNGRNKGGIQSMLLRTRIRRVLEQINKQKEIIGLFSFWLGECTMVGKRFADENGLRHYCWILGQDARPGNKFVASLSMRGRELIALSDFLQEEFEKNYGVRPERIIPPGIEMHENSKEPRDIDLLAVGSLIPLKRFELFLEAVAGIKKELPSINAVLIGEGPEHERLKRVAFDLGIVDAVRFTGSVPHEQVLALMSRARALLHPSSYEGYSGVCQEALSCGAHVVSFCRAMNEDIRQWHIVKTKEDMIEKAVGILRHKSTAFEPVQFEPMSCTARQVMDIFTSEDAVLRYSDRLQFKSRIEIHNVS